MDASQKVTFFNAKPLGKFGFTDTGRGTTTILFKQILLLTPNEHNSIQTKISCRTVTLHENLAW